MKKIILLISVAILSTSVIGCTKGEDAVEDQSPPAVTDNDNNNDNNIDDNIDDGNPQDEANKDEEELVYTNTEFGFNFALPLSWEGYTIVEDKWEGVGIANEELKESGKILNIRHPEWTEENPRQDIPIMIFTLDQWKLIEKEELSVGAAPIPPKKLGENDEYVFALPARYNFAFPTGFEEVEDILENNPLEAF